jgi:hypothetical protein
LKKRTSKLLKLVSLKIADLNGSVCSNADLNLKGLGFESRKGKVFFLWNLSSSGENGILVAVKKIVLILQVLETTSSERKSQLIIGTLAANTDSAFVPIGPGFWNFAKKQHAV